MTAPASKPLARVARLLQSTAVVRDLIVLLGILMIFAGGCIVFGIGVALLMTGALLVLLIALEGARRRGPAQ